MHAPDKQEQENQQDKPDSIVLISEGNVVDKLRILIVEDEQSIADNILYILKLYGFHAEHVLLGHKALELLSHTAFDLAILDVGLPDINGFEVCKKIRKFSNLPVIFLTARDHEIDKVVGLEIGGDDYVTKPFSPRELVARVNVILKRVTIQKNISTQKNITTQYVELITKNNILEHDDDKKRMTYCGEYLDLTRYEYGLLTTLFAYPERVFSREQLMQAVWADSYDSFDRVVDTHIKSLRAKFKKINNQYEPIKTHRGLGYSLSICHE